MTNPVKEIREAARLSQTELARSLSHDALATHKADLVERAEKHGLTNLRVFGSAARHKGRPVGDRDVLVTRSPGIGLLTIAAFVAEARKLLGVEVDVVTDGGLRADHDILTTAIAV